MICNDTIVNPKFSVNSAGEKRPYFTNPARGFGETAQGAAGPRQYTDFLHRFDRCQVVPRPGGAYNGDISIRRQTRSPPGAERPADQLHGVVTMESIILYGSRYGATRRYALALSERTGIPACSYRDKPNLSDKKIIVYLGGLYAGGVLGLAKTLRHFSLQPGQTLLIATVGLADPGDPATRANLRASLQRQLPPGLLEQAQVFHLRGGIDYRKLTPAHRAVMGLLYRALCKKPAETLPAEDRALIETYGKQVDFTDLLTLTPLVEEICRRTADAAP